MKHLLPAALALALLTPHTSLLTAQQQAPWSDAGTWAFLPGEDPYTDNTLFNLRPLLDNVAGEKGWIKHDENGGFVRGDGSPIRFWAVAGGMFEGPNAMRDAEAQARHLSKRGVNLARLFKTKMNKDGEPMNTVHDPVIEQFHVSVAAYKKHGIYSILNIYWNTDAGLFTDAARQEAYKMWWRELLTRPNPHCPNKTPLKDDPAVAILQIQNEASLFFWNSQGLNMDANRKPEYDRLNAEFKEWLKKNNLPDANLDFLFWDINRGDPNHAHEPRESLKLTMRWAAEKMRAFHEEIGKFLRDEIGCPALVNAGNWRTADQVRLLDLERWTYDANEVIAVNRYVDLTKHHNPKGNTGWLVEPGDTYRNVSCLVGDGWRNLPTNSKQIKGKPFLVTETAWVFPNLYQAEQPFLLSAYMSLSGIGGAFVHIGNTTGYDTGSWPWMPGMYKWGNNNSPENLGAWPAYSLMYHKGYIKRGAVAVDEKRDFAGDLWELKVPVITEDTGFDPNQPGTKRAQSNITGGAPSAAFMIGPVLIEYGKNPAETTINLHGNKPEDFNRGVIKSSTGEILMDTPRGICVIDAPCAQGVAGFLSGAETVKTSALTLDIFNEYGAVIAVSLDAEPLATSKKILLQITTLARPDGWAEELTQRDGADFLKILNTGGGKHNAGKNHWMVKNTSGLVAIKNAGLTKATLCDLNFYAKEDIPVKRRGDTLEIKLPPTAMYIVLE